MERALVIFGGGSCYPLSRLLKPGFGHCFVCILTDGHWIEFDKVRGKFTVRIMVNDTYDMKYHYEQCGYKVIEFKPQKPKVWKFNPFYGNIMVANCVGMAKAILSIDSFALTPYQLFKTLKRRK